MTDVIKDISTISQIDTKYLNKLIEYEIFSISDTISEDLLIDKGVSEINIGIGTLCIATMDKKVKMKFIPSAELSKAVEEVIKTGKSSLTSNLEENWVNKITTIYKEIL